MNILEIAFGLIVIFGFVGAFAFIILNNIELVLITTIILIIILLIMLIKNVDKP